MPSNFAVDVKRKDILSVFPEDLLVDPAKRGREFPPTAERVAEMARSFEEVGQLQPISVMATHDKHLEVVSGFTRHEAMLLLNSRQADPGKRRRIECKLIQGNAEDAFLSNIQENLQRNNTTAVDDAHNVRRLQRDFDKSDEEVLAIYGGKSPAWMENMRKLLTLSREHQVQIHAGQLSASTALVLADMAPEKRDAVLAKADTDGDGKVTTTDVLKAARKEGALSKNVSLKAAEMKSAWSYLREKDASPKVRTLASAILDWQGGKLPEPELFKVIHNLLGR